MSSLIFAVNLLFLPIGLIYYGFVKSFKKGEYVYSFVLLLLTGFLVWKVTGAHRSDDPIVNTQFKELLSGIIVILGILAAIVVPLLYHSKKFEEYVL